MISSSHSLKVHFYNYVDRADKMELEDHFAGLENEILNRNDEEEIMEYALNAPFVTNIDRLNRIISVYQIHNVIKFASSKFSNVKFLASTLVARFNRDIDIGDIICFIRNLEKPADLSGLQLILQEYGSISNLISVANCPGINLTRLEDTVIERETAEDIYKFASSVVGANIEKLRNAVVKLGDTSVIEKFDKKFPSHATSKSSTKKPISVTNAENDVIADICIATDDN